MKAGATVSRKDRERMADDLKALGLYATANDVRAGRVKLAQGVAHVRDYCLPRIVKGIDEIRARNAESPPIPGSWGASALPGCEVRRDALQRFLDNWAPYNFPTADREAA